MRSALGHFLSMLTLSTGFLVASGAMACRLEPEERRPKVLRWLLSWWLKGWLLPLALWMVMNFGLSWNLQPFMPQVQAARNSGGAWLPTYLRVISNGLFILSTYWAAVTWAWSVLQALPRLESESQANLKTLAWTCFLGMGIPALLTFWFGGWAFAGLAAGFVLAPLAGYAPEVLNPKKTPPMYARAVARMKFGKYSEAEWEIIHELEKHQDDFDGWMMLADLYATHFNDVAEAEQTILEICDQPRTRPDQLALALHRLADWHLKLRDDPDAARRALQIISDRLPGTHLAHMAELRSRQLPATAVQLKEEKHARPIPLPALGDTLDNEAPEPLSPAERAKAVEMAKSCVKQLEFDPNNVIARERLARLFAERLDQVDRGLDQLALLLDMPEQPDSQRAEWLSLCAAWQIKYREDFKTAGAILERLLQSFPRTPQALAARRRLQTMKTTQTQ